MREVAAGVASRACNNSRLRSMGVRRKSSPAWFTEQAATLNQRLSGLTNAVVQTKQMAEQQLLQQRDIAALKSRLNAVENERAEKPTNAASKPPVAAEEKW